MRERLVFFLYRLATGLIARLSLPRAFRVGEILGASAWMLGGAYRGTVRRNLRIAFPRKSAGEIDELAKAHFRQLGANIFSSIKVAEMKSAEIDQHVEIEGLDRMKAVFASGRGVVMMISHLGNWELFAQLAHHLPGRELATIYQPLGNRLIDADIRRTRGRRGVQPLSRRQGFAVAMRILKEKGLVGVLVDQHAGDGGIWAPFFDRLASTSPLAGILAQKTNAAVVPVAIYTTGSARWRVVVSDPLPPAADANTLTASINQVLA